jgi:hypothetical protein
LTFPRIQRRSGRIEKTEKKLVRRATSNRFASGGRGDRLSRSRRLWLKPLYLPFEICQACGKPFRNQSQMRGDMNAFFTMMTRRVAAFHRILKLFAAGATSSEAFAGGDFFHAEPA